MAIAIWQMMRMQETYKIGQMVSMHLGRLRRRHGSLGGVERGRVNG